MRRAMPTGAAAYWVQWEDNVFPKRRGSEMFGKHGKRKCEEMRSALPKRIATLWVQWGEHLFKTTRVGNVWNALENPQGKNK